jgi:cell division protein FtsB/lysophospholipase L1-like esterase
MKNTKLIALVALLVVVVLVVSVVIATSNDNKIAAGVNQSVASVEAQIKDLKAAIEELKKGNATLQETIAKLEQNGVKNDNWNGGTEALIEKAEELMTKVAEYEAAEGFNADAYNNYDDKRDEILMAAEIAMFRATSVEEMDAIIAGVLADLAALDTKVQEYTKLVESIGTVELADRTTVETILQANFTSLSADLFDGETAEAKAAAKKAVDDKFAAAYDEYVKLAKAEFVTLVGKLPEKVTNVTLEDEKALEAVWNQLLHLTTGAGDEIFGLGFDPEADFSAVMDEAGEHFEACVDRWCDLSEAKETAKEFNDSLATYFEGITFGVNDATVERLAELAAEYEELIADLEDALTVVLDPKEETHNAYVWAFIAHADVEAWSTKYTTAKTELQGLADAYFAAVKDLQTKTTYTELAQALKDAFNAWAKIGQYVNAGAMSAAKADSWLGYTGENAKNGIVAAKQKYDVISVEVTAFVGHVDAIKAYLTTTIHDIDCQKKDDANHTVCDCTTRKTEYNANLTWTSINAIVEGHLFTILATERHFTADVIGADVLAALKAAYTEAAVREVNAKFDAWKADKALNVQNDVKAYLDATTVPAVKALTVDFVVDYNEETKAYSWNKSVTDYRAEVAKYASDAYLNHFLMAE